MGTPHLQSKYMWQPLLVNHTLIAGQSVSKNDVFVKFMGGAQRLNPPRLHTFLQSSISLEVHSIQSTDYHPPSSS